MPDRRKRDWAEWHAGTAQHWDSPRRSVESFHKSALPPGGHIRALVWGEEDLRRVCLSAGALWEPNSGGTTREPKTSVIKLGTGMFKEYLFPISL